MKIQETSFTKNPVDHGAQSDANGGSHSVSADRLRLADDPNPRLVAANGIEAGARNSIEDAINILQATDPVVVASWKESTAQINDKRDELADLEKKRASAPYAAILASVAALAVPLAVGAFIPPASIPFAIIAGVFACVAIFAWVRVLMLESEIAALRSDLRILSAQRSGIEAEIQKKSYAKRQNAQQTAKLA